EEPFDVALFLEPITAAPPERDGPERQAHRPDDERRDGADHHARADAPELPRRREPGAEPYEHDQRGDAGKRRSDPVPAQQPVVARRAVQKRIAPVAVRVEAREVQVARHGRLPEKPPGDDPARGYRE